MTLDDLISAGFVKAGSIQRRVFEAPFAVGAVAPFELEVIGPVPMTSGVYIFVTGHGVKYAGLTKHSLRRRIARYVSHMNRSQLSRTVHVQMRAALNDGPVDVYILPIVEGDRFAEWRGGLKLDAIIGLEEWLIVEFSLRDEWNLG